jgi:glucose/mannose-6-phosphate isomerase
LIGYLTNFSTDIAGSFSRMQSSYNSWINIVKAKSWSGILCLGMGGSAAGGEFLSTLSDLEGNLPIKVNRNYEIPAWWNNEWLVIATSYSGNTEETIAASEKVLKQDGTLIGLCSGGELAGICEMEENAHLCLIPGGQPPRSAFGHLFGTQLAIAWELGIIQRPSDTELQQMISRIEQYISRKIV